MTKHTLENPKNGGDSQIWNKSLIIPTHNACKGFTYLSYTCMQSFLFLLPQKEWGKESPQCLLYPHSHISHHQARVVNAVILNWGVQHLLFTGPITLFTIPTWVLWREAYKMCVFSFFYWQYYYYLWVPGVLVLATVILLSANDNIIVCKSRIQYIFVYLLTFSIVLSINK